jgi:site-specific DNA recombinase
VSEHGAHIHPSPRRGLPDDKTLYDLARTYLESQHRLWPELARDGILPSLTDETLAFLARTFRDHFLDQRWQPSRTSIAAAGLNLGAAYLRFSSDQSNPRSLAQQLVNCLERAKQDGVFVPWTFVCADAAVTGTTANRRGYQMAKTIVLTTEINVRTLFIDELGRAARYAIEALRLGHQINSLRKRLVGASDGFDTDSPHHKLMLHIYAMLHEFYVDQLSQKVIRGMDDAYDLGGDMGRCAFGYRMENVLDANGHPVLKANGKPRRIRVICEPHAEFVRAAFHLFVVKLWSPNQIAEHFNDHNVGGRNTWAYGPVAGMLEREVYDGFEFRNKTKQIRDPETGKVTIKKRPESEWRRRDVPHLRIVEHELWIKAQIRLKECRDIFAGKRPNGMGRGAAYPTTLVRPICWSCGADLVLGHSGKNPSFCCRNGRNHSHDCKFRGYKMVSIVETTVLECIQERIVDADFLHRLVASANAYVKENACLPKEYPSPLQHRLKVLKRLRKRLADIIEDPRRKRVDALVDRLEVCEEQISEVRKRLKDVQLQNEPLPQELTLADVSSEMSGLRNLLNADKATAARVLRELTGPIVVEQIPNKGRKKPVWLAKFSINTVPVLAELAKQKKSPTAPFLDLQFVAARRFSALVFGR